MRIGAHQSIAGGLDRAIHAAVADGCEAVQVFTRNQNQWRAKPLDDATVARFRAAVAAWGVPRDRLLAHDSYLINVCAVDPDIRRKSQAALTEELERCAELGIRYLVMHPGSHLGQGESRALGIVARAISRALAATANGPDAPMLLLENTAGQGTNLGHRFEHLRDLIGAIEPNDRVGVCIDTQHTWAAGHDLASEEAYGATMERMGTVFGLERIRAFHLNDSKGPLGSQVDRHELIGRGHIGRDCFRFLMNDPRFAELPGVVELPPPYPALLATLRRLADGTATPRHRPRRRRLPGTGEPEPGPTEVAGADRFPQVGQASVDR